MMEDIDLKYLQEIEEAEEIENIQNEELSLSLENIKAKAIQGIQVKSLEDARKKKSGKYKKIRRMILPLVAAIGVLGGTVVAVGNSQYMRNLFGENFSIIEEQVQPIRTQHINAGVIFTVEEAIIDNKSGLIIMSCMKEDGTTFEEGTYFFELHPRLDQSGGTGWSSQAFLSEDKTKLFTILDLSSETKLHNNEITLKADLLGQWREKEIPTTVKLEGVMAQVKGWEGEDWENYDSKESAQIVLTNDLPNLKLDFIQHEKGKLGIVTSYQYESTLNLDSSLVETSLYLVDTRTGEKITPNRSQGSMNGATRRDINCHWFEGISEGTIPYLTIGVDYNGFDIEVEGQWEVKFKLDQNKNILTAKPNLKVKKENLTVKVKSLEVSALGVKIEGIKNNELMQNLDMQLLMKDGTKLPLTQSALSTRYNHTFVLQTIVDETREIPSLPDETPEEPHKETTPTPNIGLGESSYSMSTSSNLLGDKAQMPYLIDTKEVQGVIIEDILIPISK